MRRALLRARGERLTLYELLSQIWVDKADESWNCPDNDELWRRIKEAGLLTQKSSTSRIIKTRRGPNNEGSSTKSRSRACLPA